MRKGRETLKSSGDLNALLPIGRKKEDNKEMISRSGI